MRGYFGIGAEGISKPTNVGTLFRTAHAFGASFIFTVNAQYARKAGAKTDTSDAPGHVPLYSFPDVASMQLPQGCRLVGVELTEDAIELPSASISASPDRSSCTTACSASADSPSVP